MAKVLFHPEAANEYQSALDWYQARSLRAAAGFETDVDRALEVMSRTPDFYPWYDEVARCALLHRYPYTVVYQAQTDSIYVIAVAHCSRAPDYWKGRVEPPKDSDEPR